MSRKRPRRVKHPTDVSEERGRRLLLMFLRGASACQPRFPECVSR